MPLTQIRTSNLDTTNSLFFRNRIINGDMRIDQRNAGASVTQTTGSLFPVDRFIIAGSVGSKFTAQQNAGSVTPPAGFTNYLGITSSSAYSVTGNEAFQVYQVIEGFNVADLGWGTANAQACTLSFWVRSSLTGTFGGSIATTKTATWVLPFTYTISSANTWTYVTVSIPAPTSTGGTNNDNTAGAFVRFGLGSAGTTVGGTAGTWTNAGNYIQPSGTVSVVGTNAATWYITGVQLEVGTAATAFERRPYGTELQLCQRYYEKSYDVGVVPGTGSVNGYIISPTGTNSVVNQVVFNGPSYKVNKRITNPTIVIYGYSGGTGKVSGASTGADLASNSGFLNSTGESTFSVYNNSGSTLTTNSLGVIYHFTSSAEL